MKQRSITGFFIVLAVVLAVISKFLPYNIGTYIFDIFIITIIMIASNEMCNIMDKLNKPINRYMTTRYIAFNYVVMLVSLHFVDIIWVSVIELIFLLIYFTVISVVESIRHRNNPEHNINISIRVATNSILACIYPSFLFGLLLLINRLDYIIGIQYISILLIAMVFAITMLSDTFAYLVGRTFKGPKLAPKISPNKTISGGIGGLLGGIAGAMIIYAIIYNVGDLGLFLLMGNLSWWHFLLIGIFGSAISQCGDLFESFLKRKSDVKDSGNLLPGHGGMLDRIDAMIFCVTFLFIIIMIILA